MQFLTFHQSLSEAAPPAGMSTYLLAMWYDAVGNWAKAHGLVDSLEDNTAYLVHAYLHRKEGDLSNADYWYRRAGIKRPDTSLQDEWDDIVQLLL